MELELRPISSEKISLVRQSSSSDETSCLNNQPPKISSLFQIRPWMSNRFNSWSNFLRMIWVKIQLNLAMIKELSINRFQISNRVSSLILSSKNSNLSFSTEWRTLSAYADMLKYRVEVASKMYMWEIQPKMIRLDLMNTSSWFFLEDKLQFLTVAINLSAFNS